MGFPNEMFYVFDLNVVCCVNGDVCDRLHRTFGVAYNRRVFTNVKALNHRHHE